MRKGEAIRGFGWNMFFTLLNRIGLPIVNVVLATLIGPAGFGDYAALNSTYVLIELFREAGLGLTFVADKEISALRERTYNFISVANGIVFAAILFLGRHRIATLFDQPEMAPALAVLSFSMVLASLGTVPLLKMSRAARFRDMGIIDTTTNVISMVVAVVSFRFGAGFMALVYQMASRSLLFCIATNYVSPAAWGKPSWTEAASIMKVAIANMSANMAYIVYTMGDYVFVRWALGATATGLYSFAFNIANKPVEIITGPLRHTMLIAFTRDQDDPDRLRKNFGRALGAAMLLSIPVYALIFFNADAIIKIFPGQGFDGAAPYLQILCAYLFMRSVATIGSIALIAAKKERWTVYGWIPGYVVAIGYIYFMLPRPPGETRLVLPLPEGMDWQPALFQVVIGLALGAISCYVTYLIAVFRFVPPPAEVRRRIVEFIGIGLISAAFSFASSLLPIHPYAKFGIGFIAMCLVPVMLVSKKLLGSYRAGLSLSGAKRIFHEL